MEKIIEEFPNYKINIDGTVYSKNWSVNARTNNIWKPLKSVLDTGVGYYLVTLTCPDTGKRKNRFIHRLLGLAFIPNPENKPHINHRDGVKTNNHIDNLEWATVAENTQHAVNLGLLTSEATDIAVVQFSEFEPIAEFKSLHEAGRQTNIAWQNIWKVCNGRRKSAGGYYWEYKERPETIQ